MLRLLRAMVPVHFTDINSVITHYFVASNNFAICMMCVIISHHDRDSEQKGLVPLRRFHCSR